MVPTPDACPDHYTPIEIVAYHSEDADFTRCEDAIEALLGEDYIFATPSELNADNTVRAYCYVNGLLPHVAYTNVVGILV